MKCNTCGAENPDRAKFCSECGSYLGAMNAELTEDMSGEADLEAAGEADLDAAERMFSEGVESWNSVTQTAKPNTEPNTDEKGYYHSEEKKPEQNENAAAWQKERTRQRATYNQQRRSESIPSEAYQDEDNSDDSHAYERRQKNLISIAFAVIALLCLVLVLVLADPFKWFAGGNEPDPNNPTDTHSVVIKPSEDIPDFYLITVNAAEGDEVIFESSRGMSTSSIVSDKGYVIFNIDVRNLLPDAPIDTDTYVVVPKIFVIKSGETERTQISSPTVEITNIPTFAVNFDNQTASGAETDLGTLDGGTLYISGNVTPGLNITITVDNQAVPINGSTFEYSKLYDKVGIYYAEFRATCNGYRSFTHSFKFAVEEDLAPEEVIHIGRDVYSRCLADSDMITITGSVPAGAIVSVEPLSEGLSITEIPTVDANGNFSFTVQMSTPIRSYDMIIRAELLNGNTYERPFAVQRPPKYSEYVPTCWGCNYEDMCRAKAINDQQGFKIVGTVIEMLSDEDCQRAKLQLSSGQIIILNYYNHYAGSSTLAAGQFVTMYGYSLGLNSDGVLEVFIWFVND